MKVRQGFVSNSSTSSFVCDLCGRTESGRDLPIEDAEMVQCVNGHTICVSEMVEAAEQEEKSREEKIKELMEYYSYDKEDPTSYYYQLKCGEIEDEELNDIWDEYRDEVQSEMQYEMPEKYCPICQMHEFANSDLAAYLQKKTGYTREQAFARVKEANRRRKKLYDNEYVMYALQEAHLDMANVVEDIRNQFDSYREFMDFVK